MSADAVLNDGTSSKEVKVNQTQTKAGWGDNIKLPKDFTVKAPIDGASNDYWTVTMESGKVVAK